MYLFSNPGQFNTEGQLTSNELIFVQNLEGMSYSEGDILYYDGSGLTTLSIGTDGQVLKVTSGVPAWGAETGGGGGASQLSELSDVVSATNTNRFVLVANGSTGYEGRALETADIQSGTFADARISESSVTQHEGALSITESQISDLGTYIETSDIGTSVQAYDAGLQSIAGLTTSADKMIYTTGSDVYSTTNLTSFARTILGDNDASSVRSTLGLVIGTDVQAYSSVLAATTASFTTILEAKLGTIETNAKDDQTGAEVIITGYVKPASGGALSATDTVNQALGKLEKGLEDATAGGGDPNVQSDWNQTDTGADDYIKNKPTIPTALTDLDTTVTGSQLNSIKTKTDYISVTQAVDLDTMESDIATNNAKVSNATHTGDVTGSGALTIDPTAISGKTSVTPVSGDYLLLWDATDSTLKKANFSDFGGGGGTGITWNEVTGTSQTASVNNGYIANNAGLVTVTLPTTAPVGSIVRVTGKGAGGWKLAQNSGETIYFGSLATTTGTVGYLASYQQYDAVELVCITANNDWSVISSQGNITVV